MALAVTYALGLLITVIAAAFRLPLTVLVLSYLACFVVGFLLGHWQRRHDS